MATEPQRQSSLLRGVEIAGTTVDRAETMLSFAQAQHLQGPARTGSDQPHIVFTSMLVDPDQAAVITKVQQPARQLVQTMQQQTKRQQRQRHRHTGD